MWHAERAHYLSSCRASVCIVHHILFVVVVSPLGNRNGNVLLLLLFFGKLELFPLNIKGLGLIQ